MQRYDLRNTIWQTLHRSAFSWLRSNWYWADGGGFLEGLYTLGFSFIPHKVVCKSIFDISAWYICLYLFQFHHWGACVSLSSSSLNLQDKMSTDNTSPTVQFKRPFSWNGPAQRCISAGTRQFEHYDWVSDAETVKSVSNSHISGISIQNWKSVWSYRPISWGK